MQITQPEQVLEDELVALRPAVMRPRFLFREKAEEGEVVRRSAVCGHGWPAETRRQAICHAQRFDAVVKRTAPAQRIDQIAGGNAGEICHGFRGGTFDASPDGQNGRVFDHGMLPVGFS